VHRADRPPLRAAGALGGGLTSSQTADAQAGYESLMTMLPTFLAGINWVMHSAGWLEGGLVAGYEKFVLDVQVLEMLQQEFTPLEIDEASLAFDAHDEVRHGGHFLGAAHTMERFRTCFYRPFVNSSDNYERWMRNGAKDAAGPRPRRRAKRLDEYEPPPLDDAVREELSEYVTRRRRELGD
jgi:trimethylamine--corrinoid protein Co-methyltransferase